MKRRKRVKQKHNFTQRVLLILAAFLIGVILWINRNSIRGFFQLEPHSIPSRQDKKPSPEKILEQERKDLDKILKQR